MTLGKFRDRFSVKQALARWLSKESATWRSVMTLGLGEAVWRTRDLAGFAREGYQRNADVYACISRVAETCRGIPLLCYQKSPKGTKKKEITSGPLCDLLQRPNPRQGQSSFIEDCISYWLCSGNSYIERVGPRPGAPPRELYALRPDRMQVKKGDARSPIAGYQYSAGLEKVTWEPDTWRGGEPVHQVLHLKFFNPLDDWYGQSPIESAARSIDQSNSAQEWNVALTQNQGRPGLVVTGDMTIDQMDRVESVINTRFTGPENAGRSLVMSGQNMKVDKLSLTPHDIDWSAGMELSTLKICSCFGVPPELIGDSAHRTYSNYSEARKALYTETALPLLDLFVSELNYWLTPFFGEGIEIAYDPNAIEALREDQALVWQRALQGWEGGLLMQDEAREMIGKDPLPENAGQVYKLGGQLYSVREGVLQPVETPLPSTAPGAPSDGLPPEPPGAGAPGSNGLPAPPKYANDFAATVARTSQMLAKAERLM